MQSILNEQFLPDRKRKSNIAGTNKYNLTLPSAKVKITPSGMWVGKRKRNDMVTPSKKSVEMNQFISKITGKDRVQTITANRCMFCDGDASTFKDALSMKEYTISGLCQKCQDSVFG